MNLISRSLPAAATLALLLVIVLSVAGCRDAATETSLNEPATPTAQPTPTAPPRIERDERPELNAELFQAILADDEALAIKLVERGASAHAMNDNGVPVLFIAAAGCISCEGTMPELTRVLLDHGADVNATVRGTQPIHWVARAGAADRPGTEQTLDVLLQHGADINARTPTGERPVDFAVRMGNTAWVGVLVSHGATLD